MSTFLIVTVVVLLVLVWFIITSVFAIDDDTN